MSIDRKKQSVVVSVRGTLSLKVRETFTIKLGLVIVYLVFRAKVSLKINSDGYFATFRQLNLKLICLLLHGTEWLVFDLESLAPHCCGIESHQGYWILSCEEAVKLAYRT